MKLDMWETCDKLSELVGFGTTKNKIIQPVAGQKNELNLV